MQDTTNGKTFILGGGMTGLAAGISSGLPVFEATTHPGGICSSYYIRPGSKERLLETPTDGEAYRFEIGGGHWIFGGDPTVMRFVRSLSPFKTYYRRSSVYFADENRYVPYPIQNHLRFLDSETIVKSLKELTQTAGSFSTMKEWMVQSFGQTLCKKFFFPFHDLYTAGLHDRIAPQDAYKSPVNLGQVIQGAFGEASAVGYNVTFVYPEKGLNELSLRMAEMADVRYGKRAISLDPQRRMLFFSDGSSVAYDLLLSTLPLNRMIEMAGLETEAEPDPYTSVLVLNIGAVRGSKCPDDHWLYNPDAKSGFHRVGFYSNVDDSFMPTSSRERGDRVSIYIERAYVGGVIPTEDEVKQYAADAVAELQSWDYIETAEVVDPTWIDVAYTWSWPGSKWKAEAMKALEEVGVYQVGRYGRWIFQGIADSIRDGFYTGASFRDVSPAGAFAASELGLAHRLEKETNGSAKAAVR